MANAAENKSVLAQLCTIDRLVYSNYFSDTYRADFKVGDAFGTWDVTHISLPFAPAKERDFMARFGVGQDKMWDFYKAFGRCVKNHLAVSKHLLESDVDSVATPMTYEIARKDDHGSDIYLVTVPLTPIRESLWGGSGDDIILPEGVTEYTTVEQILSLGARLCQIIKGLGDVGVHLGVIDLDTVYIARPHERDLTALGGFYYAGSDFGGGTEFPPLPLGHVHPAIKTGEKAPSLVTDIYSMCSLLWSLLSGKHYTTEPDFSELPKFAPEELVEPLQRGVVHGNVDLAEDEAVEIIKALNKALHKCAKSARQEDGNSIVPMAPPVFDIAAARQQQREAFRKLLAETPAVESATQTPTTKPEQGEPKPEEPKVEKAQKSKAAAPKKAQPSKGKKKTPQKKASNRKSDKK